MFLRRCWFDAERTQAGRDALVSYRRRQNTRTEEYGAPEHDWSSHGADAMRYMAMGMKAQTAGPKWQPIKYDNRGII